MNTKRETISIISAGVSLNTHTGVCDDLSKITDFGLYTPFVDIWLYIANIRLSHIDNANIFEKD